MRLFIIIFIMAFTHPLLAQQSTNGTGSILAEYSMGSEGSIFILEDGKFALVGYSTFILGNYVEGSDGLTFTPLMPDHSFTILGRQNKEIKKGAKLTFERTYYDNEIMIKFDENSFVPVFSEDFTGGQPYYTIGIEDNPGRITLLQNEVDPENSFNANLFKMNPDFNDFLLYFHEPGMEERPFKGRIVAKDGRRFLETNWGNFVKNEEKLDDETIKFVGIYKNQVEAQYAGTVFYFNEQLKPATGHYQYTEEASVFDIKNYILDEVSNKFIRKGFYKKGENYLPAIVEDYHDESIILRYEKIKASAKENVDLGEIKISSNPLISEK